MAIMAAIHRCDAADNALSTVQRRPERCNAAGGRRATRRRVRAARCRTKECAALARGHRESERRCWLRGAHARSGARWRSACGELCRPGGNASSGGRAGSALFERRGEDERAVDADAQVEVRRVLLNGAIERWTRERGRLLRRAAPRCAALLARTAYDTSASWRMVQTPRTPRDVCCAVLCCAVCAVLYRARCAVRVVPPRCAVRLRAGWRTVFIDLPPNE